MVKTQSGTSRRGFSISFEIASRNLDALATWICLRAEFAEPLPDWSQVHEAFAAAGCKGTVEHEDVAGLSGYLPGFTSDCEIEALTARLMACGAATVSLEYVPEDDWANAWRSFFVARQVGKSLLIVPAWEVREPSEGEIVIVLEPGQAFGTGEHPTTRLCLESLEDFVGPSSLVLDIGTGSGILAIASAKLGARLVHATEADPAAATVARANFDRNGVQVHLQVTAQVPDLHRYSLVVSNLFSAVIVRLAPAIARALIPGGIWIVSGVIAENLGDVLAAGRREGLKFERRTDCEGWVCAVFGKPQVSPSAGRIRR